MKATSERPLTFAVGGDKLEGRLDVGYHRPVYKKILEKLESSPFELGPLGDLTVRVKKGIFEILASEYVKQGVPFVRVSNIRNLSISDKNLAFITEERHNRDSKTCFKSGDLLISKSGTLGSVAVVPEDIPECNISQDMIGIELNSSVNPYYIAAYLDSSIGHELLLRGTSLQVVPHLTLAHVRSVKTPLPPKSVQDETAQIVKDSLEERRMMEEDADRVMESIDDLLLQRLGMTLPESDGERPMTYSIGASSLAGNRYDAKYWRPENRELAPTIKRGKYPCKRLSELMLKPVSGSRPKGGVRNSVGEILSIGGEHVGDDGSLVLEDLKFISESFHEENKRSWIGVDDILLVKDGATTGKVGYVDRNSPVVGHNINEHVFLIRLRNNQSANPFYVFAIMRSTIGQLQIRREMSGSTQFGITRDVFQNIVIPLPRESSQRAIAEDVDDRIGKARRLREEEGQVIEGLRKRVENIILSGKET